jgi:hypothetical protein
MGKQVKTVDLTHKLIAIVATNSEGRDSQLTEAQLIQIMTDVGCVFRDLLHQIRVGAKA